MKPSLIFILSAYTPALAHTTKRSLWTVRSLNYPLTDDVPNIAAALHDCGNSGSIILAVNETFNIRSPIDLSSCRRCNFQIGGSLLLSSEWSYWQKQSAVINMLSVPNAVITGGGTSLIDANSLGWAGAPTEASLENTPKLFSISHQSYQVYIRNPQIYNAPRTLFHVDSESSAVHFKSIEIQTPAATAYSIENSKQVYVWNNTIRATNSCVVIALNTTNIQVEGTACRTDELDEPPTGIELRFYGGSSNWNRNPSVKSFRTTGWVNAVAFIAGQKEDGPQFLELKNAIFTDIDVRTAARQDVFIGAHQTSLDAIDVSFRSFEGQVEYESDMQCTHVRDICEFEQEG
jgi:hypothetical protein